VEIGLEKNGFLYQSDIQAPQTQDELDEQVEMFGPEYEQKKAPKQKIEDLLKKGQELLVQVVKEPLGTKGPRLSAQISLPGRFLVLMPGERRCGISKRIENPQERQRLRQTLEELKLVGNFGFIIRTAAEGADKRALWRDVRYLMSLWRQIQKKIKVEKSPSLVHKEFDLSLRVIRDVLDDSVNKIIVDTPEEFKKIHHFLRLFLPDFKRRLELYRGSVPLFEKKEVEKQIEAIFSRKVYLKSGSYLIIEPTEALVSVDVNSGSFSSRKGIEDTILRVNLEAAKEIARQIRLRDLGGIIVIDFIDMEHAANRQKVYRTLQEAVKRDKAKTEIKPISSLGLVEMTRQRARKSLEGTAYETCPYCAGRGSVKSSLTMSILAFRKIASLIKQHRVKQLTLIAHPRISQRLLNEDRDSLLRLEKQFHIKISVQENANLHSEDLRFEWA
jgi:ribonuclease G